ncbi:hypothetical protein EIP86_009749 [Pleurotus ostreatoroseus]|nr:hypothetical protein EIP86_009749 [Pleurotus ostreatoroseus]
MEGKLGVRGWKWLFYIELALARLCEFISSVTQPTSHITAIQPHNTHWLSPAQRRLAQVRLTEDIGEADEDAADESSLDGLKLALKDPKVWTFALKTFSLLLSFSFVNFFPT